LKGYGYSSEYFDYFCGLSSIGEEPKSVEEALNCPESVQWKKAMKEEMESLKQNKAWVLEELPQDRKTVGYKWVFKKKFKVDGTMERYKERLVAKGYS
jgi:hypothetical protein